VGVRTTSQCPPLAFLACIVALHGAFIHFKDGARARVATSWPWNMWSPWKDSELSTGGTRTQDIS